MEIIETRDGRKLTVICRGPGIEWEKIEAVEKLEIDEWMNIQVRDDDVRYTCPDFDPLGLRFENPITQFDFYMIVAQIARTKAILDHLGLEESDILWDPDYIYMSLNTRELKFIYIPTKRKDEENTMKNLIHEIMYALNQSDTSDTYMTEFAFYLKRAGAYESKSLVQYVTEKENTISRLLRLNEPIYYQLPKMEKKSEVKKEEEMPSFEIMSFGKTKKELEEEPIEKIDNIEEVEVVQEETPKEEWVPAEPVGIFEEEAEETFETKQPKPKKETKKKLAEKDFGIGDFNFLRSNISPTSTKKKSVFIDVEEISSPFIADKKPEVKPEMKPEKKSMFATILRVSTGEEKVVEGDDFYMGKSQKITGFCIEGNSAISRRHAMIFQKKGKFYIMDMESVNHTYVNGRKVKSNSDCVIKDGDVIQLANENFEFHVFEM